MFNFGQVFVFRRLINKNVLNGFYQIYIYIYKEHTQGKNYKPF